MSFFELNSLLSEGLIFSLFSIGLYVSFVWLKFPDLTPDGSFVLGPCIYIVLILNGLNPYLATILGILSGFLAGVFTAFLNVKLKIPTIISGLVSSLSLYSINWIILGKPNQFVIPENTIVGNIDNPYYGYILIFMIALIIIVVIIALRFYSDTIWGIRLRALGDNELLASDLKVSKFKYFTLGLGIANAIVSLSGILFVQRIYSVDINMGIGQTIFGLIGMLIGLLIYNDSHKLIRIFLWIVFGSVIYKSVIYLTLKIGFPAYSFRLVSCIILLLVFIILKGKDMNLLNKLKWN